MFQQYVNLFFKLSILVLKQD